jgi:hypothetical protein
VARTIAGGLAANPTRTRLIIEPGRSAGSGADQVRAGHQSQDRQGARDRNSRDTARPRSSEEARVHHPARRRGCVAAGGARAAAGDAGDRRRPQNAHKIGVSDAPGHRARYSHQGVVEKKKRPRVTASACAWHRPRVLLHSRASRPRVRYAAGGGGGGFGGLGGSMGQPIQLIRSPRRRGLGRIRESSNREPSR